MRILTMLILIEILITTNQFADNEQQDQEKHQHIYDLLTKLDPRKYQPQFFETKKHIQEQYGENIKTKKYTSTNTWILFFFVVGLTIIPIEIFLSDFLAVQENNLIIQMQSQILNEQLWFGQSTPTFIKFCQMILSLSEIQALRYTLYFIYFTGDSILATKTAFVAFFGEFIMVAAKIMYKEPRPYWTNDSIQTYKCQNDFEGPSDHIFIIIFVCTYCNLLYLRKYARTSKQTESILFFLFEFSFLFITTFAAMLLGHSYLYQCVIGVIYGLFYVILCLQLDNEIHLFVEKCAFIQKKSRKYKFDLLFMMLGCLVVLIVFYNLDLYENMTPPILWYTNSKRKCSDQMKSFQGRFIGMQDTFMDSSIIICIPAMMFGVSFAISMDEENIKWTKTSFALTVSRALIGMITTASLEYIIALLLGDLSDKHASIYVLNYMIPYVIVTFYAYGIYPVIAETIKVSRTSQLRDFEYEADSSYYKLPYQINDDNGKSALNHNHNHHNNQHVHFDSGKKQVEDSNWRVMGNGKTQPLRVYNLGEIKVENLEDLDSALAHHERIQNSQQK
eukprot:403367652